MWVKVWYGCGSRVWGTKKGAGKEKLQTTEMSLPLQVFPCPWVCPVVSQHQHRINILLCLLALGEENAFFLSFFAGCGMACARLLWLPGNSHDSIASILTCTHSIPFLRSTVASDKHENGHGKILAICAAVEGADCRQDSVQLRSAIENVDWLRRVCLT